MSLRPANQKYRQIGILLTIVSLIGFGLAITLEPINWISDYIKVSVIVVSFVSFGIGMVTLYHCRIWPFR